MYRFPSFPNSEGRITHVSSLLRKGPPSKEGQGSWIGPQRSRGYPTSLWSPRQLERPGQEGTSSGRDQEEDSDGTRRERGLLGKRIVQEGVGVSSFSGPVEEPSEEEGT